MSSPRQREVLEGVQYQGEDEIIAYTVDVSNIDSNPASVSVVVKDDGDNVVTSTVMPSGSASVSGDVITLPALQSLKRDVEYQVEVKFTPDDGNTYEVYFSVVGQE